VSGEPQRFFFVHLQKTGGTALFQRLRECFGPDAVYPGPADRGSVEAVLSISHLLRRWDDDRGALRVITGHFPFATTAVLGAPFATFTVLRDPIERTLSLLRRRQAIEARFDGLELDAIYEDEALQPIIRNHMVKMLSLRPDELVDVPLTEPFVADAAHLDAARQNLAAIDVVGIQERFDDFCGALEARFGWDLGAPRFANRTTPRPASDELRRRIAVDNARDVELYEHARGLAAGSGATG
jgi:hypothetical protein